MKDWKEPNDGLPSRSGIMDRYSFLDSNFFAIFLVLTATIFVSLAQVVFKTTWSDTADIYFLVSKIIFGFALYGIGAVLFLQVLRKKDVSYLFPFMTLSYAWVIFLSAYVFREVIGLGKILGVSLIFTGIFLIYVGGKCNTIKIKRTKNKGTKSIRIEAAKVLK